MRFGYPLKFPLLESNAWSPLRQEGGGYPGYTGFYAFCEGARSEDGIVTLSCSPTHRYPLLKNMPQSACSWRALDKIWVCGCDNQSLLLEEIWRDNE